MKKLMILFFTLALFLLYNIPCYSFPRPKKNKDVGCIIGRIEIEIDKNWKRLEAGVYYFDIWLQIINKNTGKKYNIVSKNDGYYYLLNLPPGDYVILKSDFQDNNIYSPSFSSYPISISNIFFGKKGIDVNVQPNTFTVVKSIKIFAELLPDKIEHVFKTSYVLEDMDIEDVKDYFNYLDKRNFWADFTWGDITSDSLN